MTTRGFGVKEAENRRQPDRRCAGQPGRPGEPRARAHEGRRADQAVPGLRLASRRCAALSAGTTTRRWSTRACPRTARRSGGGALPGLPTSVSRRTSGSSWRCRRSSRKTAVAPNSIARKIVASMQLALRKRPVAADAIDAAVARIEYQLLGSGEREVRSERLGELVMNELSPTGHDRLRAFRVRLPALSKTCPNSKTYSTNSGAPRQRNRVPASAERFAHFPSCACWLRQSVGVFARPAVGHSADGGGRPFSLD